jgi:ribosomal protein S18 acetylase RimI-like enzyme
MPEIEIRPVEAADIPALMALEHHYTSEYVWQMEVQHYAEDQTLVSFRQARLPRPAKVECPRSVHALSEDWQSRSGMLAAVFHGGVIGYISLMLNIAPLTAWVTDLAVSRRQRRQGVGSVLVLAGISWAMEQDCHRLVLEMQPKNYPAICLAKKLGFDFCGYHDRYYANQDTALFFSKTVR